MSIPIWNRRVTKNEMKKGSLKKNVKFRNSQKNVSGWWGRKKLKTGRVVIYNNVLWLEL